MSSSAPSAGELDRAYVRLHSSQYAEKAYLTFEQYVTDLMAVKKQNPQACTKRAKRKGSQVGGILDRAMRMTTFGYFQNIVVYKAKSGQDCQFGSLPNEGIMNTLKSFNRNVFQQTAKRAKLTLDFFCFSKVLGYFMADQVNRPWPYASPASIVQISLATIRKAITDNDMKGVCGQCQP